MSKTAAEMNRTDLLSLLRAFARQRPGLDFANYGDVRLYRNEATEITRDLRDAEWLLSEVQCSDIGADRIRAALQGSGRLTLSDDGKLSYSTGQYWCTEFRPAVSRICSQLLWSYWYHAYKLEDGNAIRKHARKVFGSRSRIVRLYFR